MRHVQGTARWVLAAAMVIAPAVARAQPPESAREPYRPWDISGGVTLRFGEHDDTVVPLGAWNAEVGRYWTPHLKTSVAVSTAGHETSDGGIVYNPAAFTTGYARSVTRPAAFAVSGAYQFLDNEFVHPYVSVGARFASVSSETQLYSTRSPYQLIGTVVTPERMQVRPTVGGGFKSYFGNGRAFMRSELQMSIAPHGTANAILLFGAGVDF